MFCRLLRAPPSWLIRSVRPRTHHSKQNNNMIKNINIPSLITAFVLGVAIILTGCDSKVGQGVTCPEVRLQYRGAILDSSLVVIVTNAGAKPLFGVCISCQRWSKRFKVSDNLKPGDTVEAGWRELPSGLRSGDVIEVYADGFSSPYRATLP